VTPVDALRALHRAGRIRTPYLSGIRVVGRRGLPTAWMRVEGEPTRLHGEWANAEPDLIDPATVGCLAALAREAIAASGYRFVGSVYAQPRTTRVPSVDPWLIVGVQETVPANWLGLGAASEGEAWAAVLVALAEEVARG
jgi:hypothetical protein